MRNHTLLALLLAVPAFAQTSAKPVPLSETVAPFIDEHTLVVVRIDISQVDEKSIQKLLSTLPGEQEADELARAIAKWKKEFVSSGGTNVLLTYGAGDYPHLPCLIAPAAESQHAPIGKQLLSFYKAIEMQPTVGSIHGCICVGSKEALAALKARKPVARPEILAALEMGKDGVAQAAFAMSAEAKKIFEQVSPTLPAELGGGRVQKVTRGMKWVSLKVGTGPTFPATLVTEALSPQAAEELKELVPLVQQALLSQLLRMDGEPDAKSESRLKAALSHQHTIVTGNRLTTKWELATTFLEIMKLPPIEAADRRRSANNLKQLMLAMHNYHDTYGRFPSDIRNKDGKPLLSWRVQLLPFMEHHELYKRFRLTESWDSEHNKKLIASMPRTLRSPAQAGTSKDRTTYLAPLGKGFIWDDPDGLKIAEITDGTSNTIAIVEANDERAVIWSKPEDISIEARNPFAGLLGHYEGGFQAAFADGSVRFIPKTVKPTTLRAMFTRDGGEVIEDR